MNKKKLWMIFCTKKNPSRLLPFFLPRGAKTRKTFTLMCNIQSMLQHYIKTMIDANPLKPKVLKLKYMGKLFLI
jgi:hypothetical protein